MDGININIEEVKQSLDSVNNSTVSASNEAEQFANGLNERASQLKNQLDDINRSLQLNPGNSELITQKYAALGRQISNARDKLEYLNNAEKQVKAEFSSGKIGAEQYDEFRREVINAESALRNLLIEQGKCYLTSKTQKIDKQNAKIPPQNAKY